MDVRAAAVPAAPNPTETALGTQAEVAEAKHHQPSRQPERRSSKAQSLTGRREATPLSLSRVALAFLGSAVRIGAVLA